MKYLLILLMLFSTGCATTVSNEKMVTDWCFKYTMECVEAPEQVELPTYKALRELPPAESMPVVAVYQFADLTGSDCPYRVLPKEHDSDWTPSYFRIRIAFSGISRHTVESRRVELGKLATECDISPLMGRIGCGL